MKAIKIATVPPPSIQAECTLKDAIPAISRQHGCAVAVMDGNRLVGSLSRDDVLSRVVGSGLNPALTKVSQVMDSPAFTLPLDVEASEALQWMSSNRKCYLGLVDDGGVLKGWIAICDLFANHVEDLTRELDSLAAYIAADGPGG